MPGGQWADNRSSVSAGIGALSYSEMLSLPGYSFSDHTRLTRDRIVPPFERPSRSDVADYYAAYPAAVGINDTIYNGSRVADVSRSAEGFYIGSLGISCKHLVLASGTFNNCIAPPPVLKPLESLSKTAQPLLVVGSGFSAADVVLSTPPWRKIIHIFKWSPEDSPSPLRGCHRQAYPEYAAVYRHMKAAAAASNGERTLPVSPRARREKRDHYFNDRDWTTSYEGLPNAEVLGVTANAKDSVSITIRLESGAAVERAVGGMQYVVGRRGSLSYLNDRLREEVLGDSKDTRTERGHHDTSVSGRSLRLKAATDLEVADRVFIIGGLTGDSLVRHAYGSCAYVAGRIMADIRGLSSAPNQQITSTHENGYVRQNKKLKCATMTQRETQHHDLNLDRQHIHETVKLTDTQNRLWQGSGWWGGGWSVS